MTDVPRSVVSIHLSISSGILIGENKRNSRFGPTSKQPAPGPSPLTGRWIMNDQSRRFSLIRIPHELKFSPCAPFFAGKVARFACGAVFAMVRGDIVIIVSFRNNAARSCYPYREEIKPHWYIINVFRRGISRIQVLSSRPHPKNTNFRIRLNFVCTKMNGNNLNVHLIK